MNVGVLIIGDEILSGRRQDKHLSKSIELLGERGLQLSWARYVGDDPQRITAELRAAFASGDLVFSFGGIGATPDDHTRACAAQALGRPLALHPEARELIIQRMHEMARQQGLPFDPDHPDSHRRLDMGRFPEGARIIPNPYNRIPGFSLEHVHFVPGFPVMAHPMVAWVLDEHYGHLHDQRPWSERSLVVFGAMEATLTPLMEAIEAGHPGVKVFSLPSVDHPRWGRHIELGVKGEPTAVDQAFSIMQSGLHELGAKLGPELPHQDGA
ncbi:MAG: competence/damage-inducible protein A [Aquabacterium sp.]|jgi:molybdopterin-biosynthesis enzyme MoeA-like protein|nr:MAG: competence/damage-inducible protein A [Aquabacterium sp.]